MLSIHCEEVKSVVEKMSISILQNTLI